MSCFSDQAAFVYEASFICDVAVRNVDELQHESSSHKCLEQTDEAVCVCVCVCVCLSVCVMSCELVPTAGESVSRDGDAGASLPPG